MPEVNPLVAVNDTVTMKLPRDTAQSAAFVVVSSAAGTFTVLPEISFDEEASYATLSLTKPDGTAAAAGIAAVGSAVGGWARIPGATHIRARLSAITAPGTGVRVRISSCDGI